MYRIYKVEVEIKAYFGTAKYTIGVRARSKSNALMIGESLAKRKYNKVLSVKLVKKDFKFRKRK